MNTYKTTSLGIGDSAELVINDVKDGKYGPVYVGTVDGEDSYIQPSGNLKFMVEKLEKGELTLGKAFVVTRTADIRTKAGYTATQFAIGDKAAAKAANAPAATTNVADKLAAIRAKRANGQSTTNN